MTDADKDRNEGNTRVARSRKTNGKTGSPRSAASSKTPSKTTPAAAPEEATSQAPTSQARVTGAPVTAVSGKRRTPSRLGPTGKPIEGAAQGAATSSASQAPAAGSMPKVSRSRKDGGPTSKTPSEDKIITPPPGAEVAGDHGTTTRREDTAENGSDEAEAQAEATPPAVYPTPAPTSEPRTEARRGGFFPMVLGGIVAGLIGYGTAQYLGPDGWFPTARNGDQDGTTLAELQAQIEELRAEAAAAADGRAALEAELASARSGATDSAAPLVDRLDGLQINSEELDQRLAALEEARATDSAEEVQQSLATFEERQQQQLSELRSTLTDEMTKSLAPVREGQDALGRDLAALQERVARLEEGLEARLAEVSDVRESAEAAEARARRQAALADIQAALTSGAPYQEPVSAIAASMDGAEAPSVPEALAATAQDGVATLAQLQQDFPDAARAALAESIKATAGDDPVSRFGAFLRTQTGARSLSARDGDDPDAILSQAQDALNQGRVEETLTLLERLPEEGRAEMATWMAAARDRVAALAAFDEYSASLAQN